MYHPIVKLHQKDAESSEIAEFIATEYPPPQQEIIESLRIAYGDWTKPDMLEKFYQHASKVPIYEGDPALYALFLIHWINITSYFKRYEEARMLCNRALELQEESIPNSMKAILLMMNSIVYTVKGNSKKSFELLSQAVNLIDKSDIKYKIVAINKLKNYSSFGMMNDCLEELDWLEKNDTRAITRARIDFCKTMNSCENCHVPDMKKYITKAKELSKFPEYGISTSTRDYEILAKIIAPKEFGNYEIEEKQNWANSTFYLLSDNIENSLNSARKWFESHPNIFHIDGFNNLIMLRAELASGNIDAAATLYDRIMNAGAIYYYLDFIESRIWLAKGNMEKAVDAYKRLLVNVDRYGSHNRLDLEWQMSHEVSRRDMSRLIAGATQNHPYVIEKSHDVDQKAERHIVPEHRKKDTGDIIGNSPQIHKVREAIARFAAHDIPVLVHGETGTGKELVARALHRQSPRKASPFIAINCGAIAESLLESELFGHEKAAFTGASKARKGVFESAGDGTVFLDEIGEISPRLQVALLRVLETGEIRPVGSSTSRSYNCRVVAATNAPLNKLVGEGKFRRDLLYRLQRLVIEIPPLREREGDIIVLAGHFLDIGRESSARAIMSEELKQMLSNYDWPGNVRELRNEIERMRLFNSDKLSYDSGDLDQSRFVRKEENNTNNANDPLPENQLDNDTGKNGQEHTRTDRKSDALLTPQTNEMQRKTRIEKILNEGKNFLRRRERLTEIFREYPILTRAEVVRITGVSPKTATSDLKALCDEGVIEKICPSRSPRTHYFRLIE